MRKYKVQVRRTLVARAEFEIEASDENDAWDVAEDVAYDRVDWNAAGFEDDDVEVDDVEEIKED